MGIKVAGLFKSFGSPPQNVLSDISFEISSGEFVALTGRSGSGKSTLLYLLSTLDQATSGELVIDDKKVSSFTNQELHLFRNKKMGFVFQFHYLLPELSVIENVLMPAVKSREVENRRAYATEILSHFGMKDKLSRLPRQLSGGEQQRVAIARALVMKPAYLFADEPTGSLDSANGEAIMKIMREVNEKEKTTLILVTHDEHFAKTARRQIKLADGKIVEDSKN